MHRSGLNLPVRRQKIQFALTPLADIMFQLLIFFMLASSLTPYSLLPLQSAGPVSDTPAGQVQGTDQAASEAHQVPGRTALWTLGPGTLRIRGQEFSFDSLPGLTAALTENGIQQEVVVIVTASARVQDVATVLEQLHAADVTSIQLSAGDS